jgi:hypothetical protein
VIRQKPVQTYYDHDHNQWVIVVPAGTPSYPKGAVQGISQYILKVNLDRWHATPAGDQKDRIGKALKALQDGRIIQKLTGRGDNVMFQSTEKMRPDRTIFT